MKSNNSYEICEWIKDEKDADFMYGGVRFIITDSDIERLKNGEILNFSVNMEYGCTLKYERCESMNIYDEAIRKTRFNSLLDADICKLNALIIEIKNSDKYTGCVETDYIKGLKNCIEVLESLRFLDDILIKYESENHYSPIKNTTREDCYKLLYQFKCLYEGLYL